jgi:hypothetical protein
VELGVEAIAELEQQPVDAARATLRARVGAAGSMGAGAGVAGFGATTLRSGQRRTGSSRLPARSAACTGS